MAARPVAACRSSGEMPRAARRSSIQTAANQVMIEAAAPTPAPAAIGRRRLRLAPIRLATIAISTRIDSRPSRKTSRPLLNAAAPELRWADVGIRDAAVDGLRHDHDAEEAEERDEDPAMARCEGQGGGAPASGS